jgi:CrcB protein
MTYLYVAVGGALGALSRFLTMNLIGANLFPYSTFAVNILGSFLLGAFISYESHIYNFSSDTKALVVIGFLGAFTTFSTFSMDTIDLFQKQEYIKASFYVTGSLAFSCLGFIIGLWLFKQ